MSIAGDARPLNQTLAKVRSGLLGLARTKFNLPGGGIAGALGLAGAGLGVKSVIDDAVEMESKIVALGKAADLEGKALANMKAELLKLSVAIAGVRVNDLLDIATAGAKLGIAAKDLPGYAEGVAKVATAMDDIPAGVIADEIGKLNSVFGLDAVRGTMQFGSAIDKVADSGSSSAKDILNVTQRISGAAKAARITAPETVALAGALLDTGTSAELAAGSLLLLIQALNSPDLKERQNFAKVLGMDMKEFAKLTEDKPIAAIQKFLGALKGMDAISQQKALNAIGIERVVGTAEIQKLVEKVDTLGMHIGNADSEFQTLDQITKSYNATAEITKSQLAVMANRLQILGASMGATFLPAVNAGLSLLGDLATGLGDMWAKSSEGVKSWGVDFSDVFETIGFGFRNMGDLFDLAGTHIGGGVQNLVEVFQYVGAVVGSVAKYLWESLVEAFDIVVNAAMNTKDNLVNIFTEIWEAIKAGLSGKDHVMNFHIKGLMDGIDLKGDGKFKMPDPLTLSNVDNQLDVINQRIADREAARNAGKVAGGPGKGGPGAAAGDDTFGGGGGKKGQVSDLASFARSLQEAAGGKGNLAERAAKAAERTAKATEKLAAQKSGVGTVLAPNPAWQAAGLP